MGKEVSNALAAIHRRITATETQISHTREQDLKDINKIHAGINNTIGTLATAASVVTFQSTIDTCQASVNTQSQKILDLKATQDLNGKTVSKLEERLEASEKTNSKLLVDLGKEQATTLALQNQITALTTQLQDLTLFVQNIPQLTQQVNKLEELTPAVDNIKIEQAQQNQRHTQLQKTVIGFNNKIETLSDRAIAVHKEVTTNLSQHSEILNTHKDKLVEQKIELEKANKEIKQHQSQIEVQLNKNTKFEQRFVELHKTEELTKGKVNKLIASFEGKEVK